jgi:hypothetical protein
MLLKKFLGRLVPFMVDVDAEVSRCVCEARNVQPRASAGCVDRVMSSNGRFNRPSQSDEYCDHPHK